MDTRLTKAEILTRLKAEHDALAAMLAELPLVILLEPNLGGGWSVKDVIAHFILHEQHALAELQHALCGEPLPADEMDNDIANARAVAQSRAQAFIKVKAGWDRSYREVFKALEAIPEAEFEPGSRLERVLGDSVEGTFGNNTYEHYAEHSPAIRSLVSRQKSRVDF